MDAKKAPANFSEKQITPAPVNANPKPKLAGSKAIENRIQKISLGK